MRRQSACRQGNAGTLPSQAMFVLGFLGFLCGCSDPADDKSVNRATQTATREPDRQPATKPATRAADPAARVQFRVTPQTQTIFRGELVRVSVAIENRGSTPSPQISPPLRYTLRKLWFLLRGEKGQYPLGVDLDCRHLPSLKNCLELGPGKTCTSEVDIEDHSYSRIAQPDTYTLTAAAVLGGHDFGQPAEMIQAPPVEVIVQAVPELEQRQTMEIPDGPDAQRASRLRVCVGLAPHDETSGLLLAACRPVQPNGAEYPLDGTKWFLGCFFTARLGIVPRDATVQATFVPSLESPLLGDVHILVNERRQAQRYFVVSLSSRSIARSESFPERKVRFLKSETTGKVEVEIK